MAVATISSLSMYWAREGGFSFAIHMTDLGSAFVADFIYLFLFLIVLARRVRK